MTIDFAFDEKNKQTNKKKTTRFFFLTRTLVEKILLIVLDISLSRAWFTMVHCLRNHERERVISGYMAASVFRRWFSKLVFSLSIVGDPRDEPIVCDLVYA